MARRTIQLDKIVAGLKAIPAIANIAPGGIYFGKPGTKKDKNYISIRLLMDRGSDFRKARVEFTFIAGSQATPAKQLFDMMETVNDNIVGDIEAGTTKFSFDDFKVTFVDMFGNTFGPNQNLENRLFIQTDYLFKYWRT